MRIALDCVSFSCMSCHSCNVKIIFQSSQCAFDWYCHSVALYVCDLDIDAFLYLFYGNESVYQIQCVSVYLIASALHNRRLAKWRQLHGVDVGYIQS